MKYYNGDRLLSMMDINGNKPEIFICTSNRSAGKTTWFARRLVQRYLKYGEKFCLLYRYSYELTDCADKFFKDIGRLFFSNYAMESKSMSKGVYHELHIMDASELDSDGPKNYEVCGYAVALNTADTIKKLSHLLSDVQCIMFDEFQSETNHYASNEIAKLLSIHTSIARGNGEMVRYVPVYMISNPVSIINPYYTALGISERLRVNTKFLRGDGYVLEQGFNQAASEAQLQSAFNRAFAKDSYVGYAAQAVYLNDNQAFISQPSGRGRYVCTIKYNDTNYAVREYAEQGYMYVDTNADITFPTRIALTTADHQINYVMLKRNDFQLQVLRQLFELGAFRFKDLRCKEALMKAISY